jgi:hypothetical protein
MRFTPGRQLAKVLASALCDYKTTVPRSLFLLREPGMSDEIVSHGHCSFE